MINSFLKAKHWQLFLATFGIPMILQFLMIGSLVSSIAGEAEPDPSIMLTYIKFMPAMMIIFMGVFFGWFWAVAVGLQKRVPQNVKMKVGRFKVFLLIPLLYITLLSLFIGIMMNGGMFHGAEPHPGIFGLIFFLHLFSMFCIFYCLYFVAKTFKTVELQRETSFSDFAGEFFMIWFYPIGIWIIQPKINKMMEG